LGSGAAEERFHRRLAAILAVHVVGYRCLMGDDGSELLEVFYATERNWVVLGE
jgi:hypothetical protein